MRLKNMHRLIMNRLWKKVRALPDPQTEAPEETPMSEISAYALKTYPQQAEEIVAVLMSISASTEARITAAMRLDFLKKRSKLSWGKLCVTDAEVNMMQQLLAMQPEAIKASPKTKAISAMFHPNTPEKAKPVLLQNDIIRQNRDLEVTRLHALGKNKTEIAKLVGIHRRSVDRILDKLTA